MTTIASKKLLYLRYCQDIGDSEETPHSELLAGNGYEVDYFVDMVSIINCFSLHIPIKHQ